MQRKVFDRKVFNRKLVLITGGCAGIGRALAVRMAQAGARLVIFDLHQDALDGLVDAVLALRDLGVRLLGPLRQFGAQLVGLSHQGLGLRVLLLAVGLA